MFLPKTIKGHQTTGIRKHWNKCFRKWIELNCYMIKATNEISENRNVVYAKTLHITKEPALTKTVKTNINQSYLSSCIHEQCTFLYLIYINNFTYSNSWPDWPFSLATTSWGGEMIRYSVIQVAMHLKKTNHEESWHGDTDHSILCDSNTDWHADWWKVVIFSGAILLPIAVVYWIFNSVPTEDGTIIVSSSRLFPPRWRLSIRVLAWQSHIMPPLFFLMLLSMCH